MYSIGTFAKICNTTITEIRFYDLKGILPADEISESGRRLYSEESYQKYIKIQRLQEAGFSLSEIQAHLNEADNISNVSFFAHKRDELRKKLELLDELEKEDVFEQIKPKKKYHSPISEMVDIENPEQVSTLIDILNGTKTD